MPVSTSTQKASGALSSRASVSPLLSERRLEPRKRVIADAVALSCRHRRRRGQVARAPLLEPLLELLEALAASADDVRQLADVDLLRLGVDLLIADRCLEPFDALELAFGPAES